MMSYAMQRRIERINEKKQNGNDKSQLYNNKMFKKFVTKLNDSSKTHYDDIYKISGNSNNNQYIINDLKNKIEYNNKMSMYALKINSIINDLHDTVDNASPVINTPEHPFTKMNIENYLLTGTAIQPYIFEFEPTINIDNNNVVSGMWTDRIDIGGFQYNNIEQIYNLVVNNNICEYIKKDDDTVEFKLYELNYEHFNGNVTFIRSIIIDTNNNLMSFIKTWNITLNC